MQEANMRLFIGLELGKDAREALAESAARLRGATPGRYAEATLYHVTLAFLGMLPPAAIAEAKRAMEAASRGQAPVGLRLDGLGYFGRAENAILYGKVSDAEALDPLADRLRAALSEARLPFDPKPFKPHITLARHARIDGPLDGYAPRPAAFMANALTLFHSTRVRGELTYLPIERASFAR